MNTDSHRSFHDTERGSTAADPGSTAVPVESTSYDVVVVGGGAAGLSAATTLARSLRSVLLVDAGEPRNAPAHAAHNLLGREGVNPLELLAAGRSEAEAYGARIVAAEAVSAAREGEAFAVVLSTGTRVTGRRLLLATGLVDELPDVPGVRGEWGGRVLHCPYCHGYEVRGQRIGILATTPFAVHQALLFRQLSDTVTVFLHRIDGFGPEESAQLAALGVRTVPGPVARVEPEEAGAEHADDHGSSPLAVVLAGGERIEVDALAVGPRMIARGGLYEQLGGELSEHPMGRFIETGPMGRTPIEGVWAAGNSSDLSAMVSVAGGGGTMAAAAINAELALEDARAAAARTAACMAAPTG
ncbi:NAD(P)/FAD-dependent oxidoreductase [Zafaria sp. Z1313]|uniref:NAD(P)/FAD-dependent oxidoreductase n=1 Tax=unclassified Zafaria TaxID=2828765 RepID=UPI002E78625B|nr:NAD(P)/FAD-dependent oxidoreductase [Zafaria sp. J156]MEE1622368.1 NAD(P)/FAD-dependent oxidoreductase [Zafaria sp. J156]